MKKNQYHVEPSIKLFEGERGLVLTGVIGFILAAMIALYIFVHGPNISPEGNMKDAFSFNAAIGIYILSIAAILPLARFSDQKRRVVRWLFILASFYCYTIETVQNFRGISPRFSREGAVIDTIAGILFGVVSLVLVALAVVLTIRFLRMKGPFNRPLLILGIRYAFLSVIAANVAGLWMILLQDRFTGDAGNVIVLHGMGFHALQTLLLPAWLLEKTQIYDRLKKFLVHLGSIAWLVMILSIAIQTGLGHSAFELTTLSVLGTLSLLIWFGSVGTVLMLLLVQRWMRKVPPHASA
jgi:hypothetical protein